MKAIFTEDGKIEAYEVEPSWLMVAKVSIFLAMCGAVGGAVAALVGG